MAPRDQADRDTTTVEIGYALTTAAFLAVVTGLVLASPILILDSDGPAPTILGARLLPSPAVCSSGD